MKHPYTGYNTLSYQDSDDRTPSSGIVPFDMEPLESPPTWRSRASAFFNSKPAVVTLWTLNIAYSTMVSAIFFAFSARRAKNPVTKKYDDIAKVFEYGIPSVLMNWPMAIIFALNAVKAFKRLGKKDTAYRVSFAAALALSLLTTAAGFQVAVESAAGLGDFIPVNAGVIGFATSLSLFNTWSTRFVGSVHLIYSLYQGASNLYYNNKVSSASYYQLREDIARHGHLVTDFIYNDSLSEAENLRYFSMKLYAKMAEKGLRPGTSWTSFAKKAVDFTVTATILSIFIVNMMPLWIKLTVGGAEKFSASMASSYLFVLAASPSNELFYLNSGRTFTTKFEKFCSNAYSNTMKRFENYDFKKVVTVFAFGMAAILSGWAVSAYFSGGGFGEDGLEAMMCGGTNTTNGTAVNATVSAISDFVAGSNSTVTPTPVDCVWPEGFGPMAGELWFSWMGWWTNLFSDSYDKIAAAAAGSVVNGGAFLNFWVSHPFSFGAWFKEDTSASHHKVLSVLDEQIQDKNFKALEDAGLRDTVEQRRDMADPYTWRFWKSAEQRDQERRLPINSPASFEI